MESDSTFFCDYDKSDISLNDKQIGRSEKQNLVLDIVRSSKGISCWDLERQTGIPHTTLYGFLVDLEHSGIVFSKIRVNDQNRTIRLFYSFKKHGGLKEENVGQ